MKILYVNACIRPESRTKILADYLLNKLDGEIKEVNLNKEKLSYIDYEFLQKIRHYISLNQFDGPIFFVRQRFCRS